jgi:hypothetical protein
MRKVIVALFALAAAFPATVSAQAWAEKMFQDKDSKDNPLVHDFGSVPRGSHLLHRFKITNIYAVPMDIVSLRPSCGCGSATATKTTLQPRESGYIEVTVDTTRFQTPKKLTVAVTVGPQYVSTADLQLSFDPRNDVVFNPGQASMGVVPQGKASEKRELDVEYAGALDWKVTEVVTNDLPIEASFKEWYSRPGTKSPKEVGYKISVALKAGAAPGPFKQAIYLKTNDPNCPLLPVLVEATVQAPLTATPNKIEFGTATVGQPITKRVIIKANKACKITAIDGQADGVTAELPEGAKETHFLTIKWLPTAAGELKRSIVIKTDLDQDASVTVMLEGKAEAP